jgi:RNA polymerase sigma-70 factor (ECF subfamily)
VCGGACRRGLGRPEARRAGRDPHEAKDLVQGYLARLLEREDLARVGPDKGRFRSYLLAGLQHHLVSEERRKHAQKRGGDAPMIPLDGDEAEALCGAAVAGAATPDVAFDRRWAETVLDRALVALEQEHLRRGKQALYETLKPTLAGDEAADYAQIGRALGMTPGAVAVAVHRLRVRLRELVRTEVAQTVGSVTDLEEEMRSLQAILAG